MSPYATGHAHLKFTFRKCTSFLNSEYNFQFYWRVINVQQYRLPAESGNPEPNTVAFSSINTSVFIFHAHIDTAVCTPMCILY